MVEDSAPVWSFLTNHAQVLVCIANDSAIRLRDIGERVAITERAAHRIVSELAAAGCITARARAGATATRSPPRPHFPTGSLVNRMLATC